VSAGALCKILLGEFGIRVASHVIVIGGIASEIGRLSFDRIVKLTEKSPVRCADRVAAKFMCMEIDRAAKEGDTLGGVFEVLVKGVPPGLGSYTQWDRRIDAALSRAVMSIQAIKGISFGAGFEAAILRGSQVHDEIFYSKNKGFFRNTNNAGGVEGGMTNGEDIVLQAVMKPIATLRKPLSSVNIRTKKTVKASVERSDVCAVPAAGVVAESAVAIEMANSMIEKFGGDSLCEMKRNYDGYIRQVRRF
jgi:chorismate synthase